MSLGQRVRAWRNFYGWTLDDLASRSDVGRGTIGAMEMRGSNRSEFGNALAKAFGITYEDLLNESLNPYDALKNPRDEKTSIQVTPINMNSDELSEISTFAGYAYSDTTLVRAPAIEWARLGVDLFKEANELDGESVQSFVPMGIPGPRTKLVPIMDDSLAPRLNLGDLVAIDPDNKKPERGQVTLFQAKSDGKFLLRRYQPLVPPAFEAIDAKGNALDSERHGLEIIGVRCGVRLADI